MCNLYSITTNQAAIAALFRVVNRYVGNLAPMPGVFPGLSSAGRPENRRRERDGADALGHAATTAIPFRHLGHGPRVSALTVRQQLCS